MNKNHISITSSREVKTAKNKGSNTEQMLLPFRIQTQYRAHVFVRLKKYNKCIRPVIYAYGTDAEKAAVERVQNEMKQNGYNVASLNSKSQTEGTSAK